MKDKYDLEIARLIAIPRSERRNAFYDAWSYGPYHSCLFDAASKNGSKYRGTDSPCGCLTQIRYTNGVLRVAGRDDLTEAIIADKEIPPQPEALARMPLKKLLRTLERFAYWQRIFDKEIRGIK